MVELHNGTVWGTQSISYWPLLYITIYLLILTVERLYRILRSSLRKKKSGEKENLHRRTHYPSMRIFRLWPFFYGQRRISVWTILSKHLSFVWLCVSSIERGTRRIMPPDELSFAILFERRTKRSSLFAWYKRRTTRRTHSLQLCLVPRLHYYAPPVRFGSRGPIEFRLRYVTEMNWPRRPGKTPYSHLATFNSPLSHSFSDVIICFGEF